MRCQFAQRHFYKHLRLKWAHPFYLPETSPSRLLNESQRLQLHSQNALRLIDALQAEIPGGLERLDYYRHSAGLGLCLARQKQLARQRQLLLSEDIGDVRANNLRHELVQGCREQIASLSELENQHKDLWLRTNRPDNLSRILNLYRRLQANYSSAIDEFENNHDDFPAAISAQWIAFSCDSVHHHACFRKQFSVPDANALERADLQLVGNTDATIYLNGREVGRVYATKSLSLWVENQRVGWWRVAEQLQSGDNVLAVEVSSYYAERPAAANVYLELQYPDGAELCITSDPSWQAGLTPQRGWKRINFREEWPNAEEYPDYPWQLSMPMFEKGFASRLAF